jgi:hypothetical protein
MQNKAENYHILLKQLVNLQKRLLQVFETSVEVVPPPVEFLDRFEAGKLKNAIIRDLSITEILRSWPVGISVFPLVTWVRPRKGIVELERQIWFFSVHGHLEITFIRLPVEIEEEKIKALRSGEVEVLLGLSGLGPEIEAAYFGKGRKDGVSVQAMYLFARSSNSQLTDLSEGEHEELLEELVRQGFLVRALEHPFYFVLATNETEM